MFFVEYRIINKLEATISSLPSWAINYKNTRSQIWSQLASLDLVRQSGRNIEMISYQKFCTISLFSEANEFWGLV